VALLLAGTAPNATPLERALIDLVRRAHETPALLTPSDLDPVRALVGDGALDYVLVLCAFHFINRIADLLAVPPEAIPESLRRFEPLRRVGVRVASMLLGRMDLKNRAYTTSFDDARARLEAVLGRRVGAAVDPLRQRPKLVESIALAVEERDHASSLPRAALGRVQSAVAAALPRSVEEATGFHTRPTDPVEAFAFVGTRYASRIPTEQIVALRHEGFDDSGILDLAVAVADANQWERMYRLAELPEALWSVTR
jgi:alkylhydroperoxidase family enzyme